MLELSHYPIALQLLMQTDGTVTELIKLLSGEDIKVIKTHEDIEDINNKRILHRHIYLQGKQSKKNWVYAESEIYLENLSDEFVHDLLEKTIPIGTLWTNYKIETYKEMVAQYEETTNRALDFQNEDKLLVRIYNVYNQNKLIMQITEKFPIQKYTLIRT